jgi:hypothetical protein
MIPRRTFISLIGGAVAAWPLAARAQPAGKVPTIGFLGADAAGWRPWTDAFVGQLRKLGWIEGRTIAIEYRWSQAPRARRRDRGRVCSPQGRRHCHERNRRPHGKAGDSRHPHLRSTRSAAA